MANSAISAVNDPDALVSFDCLVLLKMKDVANVRLYTVGRVPSLYYSHSWETGLIVLMISSFVNQGSLMRPRPFAKASLVILTNYRYF